MSDEVYRCDACGFEHQVADAAAAVPAIAEGAAEMARLVASAGTRARPAPDTWSRLEYACHLRDVLLVQRERVLTARRVEGYECPPMARDERVEHDGYAEQDPADVARQLTDAAALFVNVLRRLGPADWDRTLVYGFPGRAERSLRWVAVHTLHEVRHHLGDVARQAAQ